MHIFFMHWNVEYCDQQFKNSQKMSVCSDLYASIIKYIQKNGSLY